MDKKWKQQVAWKKGRSKSCSKPAAQNTSQKTCIWMPGGFSSVGDLWSHCQLCSNALGSTGDGSEAGHRAFVPRAQTKHFSQSCTRGGGGRLQVASTEGLESGCLGKPYFLRELLNPAIMQLYGWISNSWVHVVDCCLHRGGQVPVWQVCVYLLCRRITQKQLNWYPWKHVEGWDTTQGRASSWILMKNFQMLVQIQIKIYIHSTQCHCCIFTFELCRKHEPWQ